ncbi:alpha-hydroxy-acid oxidizing protein [Candidatus Thalassolituus haligoni]|uniref:alpha-hydroxy-acid oxidizing protein n=1 Tax=Candidatus Thalassolituus haligoni TaxID=3100113 RepID=UPI0035178E22
MKNKLLNSEDFRCKAQKKLPGMVFDYLEGGADDEVGLKHNRSVLDAIRFKPKRLINVKNRSIGSSFLGGSFSAPIAIGPTGLNGMLSPDGDFKLARAAARANIPFALSTASNASIEDIAKVSDGELWFQLYVVHRDLAKQMVERALKAGYKTLILTVDVSINGFRERDIRNGFSVPFQYTLKSIIDGALHPDWSLNFMLRGAPELANFKIADVSNLEVQAALMSRQMDASFNWQDLTWLRDIWPHRLLVKGITSTEDAARCADLGVDGVILSNHGARQLDSCISPVEILEETASAINIPVLVDSGFRRGADVVKALALGATAVLIGRPVLYALAAEGEAGVDHMLQLLKNDIDRTLAHIGCADINTVDKSFLSLK